MDACGCDGGFEIFDRRTAEGDIERYRRHGPDDTTRMLLDMIRERGVGGASVLDVGGGVGVIDHELLRAGAGHATIVEASAPSLVVARDEARRRGHLDRLEFVDGDFVSRAAAVDPADIVTLDRVVCCYPDVVSLYGLVLPRDRRLMRWGMRIMNVWFRLRRLGYRAYAHPNAVVDGLVADAGLRPAREDGTFVWRVVLYERVEAPA